MNYNVYATTVGVKMTYKTEVCDNELIPTLTKILLVYVKKDNKGPLTINVFPQNNGEDKEK